VKVYCPVAPEATRSSLTPAAADGPPVLGVLDDHLDPPFMEALVERLRRQVPNTDIRVWIKPLGTAPAPDDIILEMAGEVRLALVGVGL
jgi:hypothetical protein